VIAPLPEEVVWQAFAGVISEMGEMEHGLEG
jgi:hypothetical protein